MFLNSFHPPVALYFSIVPLGTYSVTFWYMLLSLKIEDTIKGLTICDTKEVRPEQSANAYLPMLVTLLGIVIEVRPEQPENAEPPMLVTLLGIVTEVRPEQPEKALFPMLVTLLGMVIEVSL